MIKYTKYGKHRYKIYFYDDNFKCVNTITEGINSKNVNDMMIKYVSNSSNVSFGMLQYKQILNKYGVLGFTKDGYFTNIDGTASANYRLIFVDMAQLDKVKTYTLFRREFILKELLNDGE